VLTLAAPTPAASVSLDVALNLGATAADQSCNAAHPATASGARAWLRAANGSCAVTADRDPASRASFGLYAPETRKTVHARELF
jgi:MSHA biogenesis protein MshQ